MNLKQMITAETSKYLNVNGAYHAIESGYSVKPIMNYCEFTGFVSRYKNKKSDRFSMF